MALNQVEIAPEIVNALFYGIVAVVVGSAIVAIGGGGIQPMRARWEKALNRWDEEQPRLRSEIEQARMEREAKRQIDLRDQTVLADSQTTDSTNEMPVPTAGRTMSGTTQDRIRAEIKSDPTLP